MIREKLMQRQSKDQEGKENIRKFCLLVSLMRRPKFHMTMSSSHVHLRELIYHQRDSVLFEYVSNTISVFGPVSSRDRGAFALKAKGAVTFGREGMNVDD